MLRLHLVLTSSLALSIASSAIASPIFLIESGPEWQAALNDGRVSAISNYADIEAHFPGRSSDFVVPTLTVVGDSLVEDFGPNSNTLGGFTYAYPADPDLNGKRISYKSDPGTNVTITIVLTDVLIPGEPRKQKVFEFKTSSNGGGRVSLDFPADASDAASIGADFIGAGTGFRLSQVATIQYVTSDGTRITTDEINVTPEPGGILLAGLAAAWMLPLAGYRSCRRP